MKDVSFEEEVKIHGVVLTVSGITFPPSRGERDRGTGLLLSPDEPGGIEIDAIMHGEDDVTDLLSQETIKKIEAALIEKWASEGGY